MALAGNYTSWPANILVVKNSVAASGNHFMIFLSCHDLYNLKEMSSTMLRRSPRQIGRPAAAAAPVVNTQAQGYTNRTLLQGHYHAFYSTGVIGKPCCICKRPYKYDLAARNSIPIISDIHQSAHFIDDSNVYITQGR